MKPNYEIAATVATYLYAVNYQSQNIVSSLSNMTTTVLLRWVQ